MYFQGLVEEGDTTVSGLLDFGIRTGNVEQFHMGLHRAAAWRVVCLDVYLKRQSDLDVYLFVEFNYYNKTILDNDSLKQILKNRSHKIK